MTTLATWPELLEAVQPFLTAASPLQAMNEAGFVFADDLSKSLEHQRLVPTIDLGLLQQLQREYGPPPPLRLYVGRLRRTVLQRAGGYRAIGSAGLGLVNQIVDELWRVHTIPNSFDQAVTDSLISISKLTDTCNGVPADATSAVMYVTTAPAVTPSEVSPQNAHIDIGFQLLLNSSPPVSLEGAIRAELPLKFEAASLHENPDDPASRIVKRIRLTSGAIGELTASVDVSPASAVQPTPGGLPALNNDFAVALQRALLYLLYEQNRLLIPGQVGLGPSLPNSEVKVSQVGAVTVSTANNHFAIAGINVEGEQPTDPSVLSSEELPAVPTDVHLAIDQEFATDALSTAVESGDLSAFIERLVARHLPLPLAPFVVTGGNVTIESNGVHISIDVVWQGACDFGTDLSFTVTLWCSLSIDNGQLAIDIGPADVDISTWDEIKCTLLAVPVVGTLVTLIVVAIGEALPSFLTGSSHTISIKGTSPPLPGSEKVVTFAFTQVTVSPGTLRMEAQARLIWDPSRTFVYVRLLEGLSPLVAEPLAGATAQLLEVHDFAQAPPTGETDIFVGKREIDTVTSFQPLGDLSLGSATTDATGYLRFAVVCPEQAGILTTTTTTSDPVSGHVISTTTKREVVSQGWTDLALTVTDAGGTRFTTRQLVGVNIVNKRLGSRENPIVLLLRRPHDATPTG